MSVKAVKAISIIGMMTELDEVIQFCGASEVFHPDDAMSFYSNTQSFIPLNDKNPYSAPLQSLRSAADMAGLELKYTELKDFKQSPSEVLNYTEELVARLQIDQTKSFCGRCSRRTCPRKPIRIPDTVPDRMSTGR